jgi:hypothetical protein
MENIKEHKVNRIKGCCNPVTGKKLIYRIDSDRVVFNRKFLAGKLEHLLACLANQKFINSVNGDGLSLGKKKVLSIQQKNQKVIDNTYKETMEFLQNL